jgi:hypothetical protein
VKSTFYCGGFGYGVAKLAALLGDYLLKQEVLPLYYVSICAATMSHKIREHTRAHQRIVLIHLRTKEGISQKYDTIKSK